MSSLSQYQLGTKFATTRRVSKTELLMKCLETLKQIAFCLRLLDGGAEGIRTPDPHNAIVVLYQLSYDPNQSAQNLKNSRRLSKGFFLERPSLSHEPKAVGCGIFH